MSRHYTYVNRLPGRNRKSTRKVYPVRRCARQGKDPGCPGDLCVRMNTLGPGSILFLCQGHLSSRPPMAKECWITADLGIGR